MTASNNTRMKKLIALGATSGIAMEVQRQLAHQACELLLVARSPERLAAIQTDLLVRGAPKVLTYSADISCIAQHAGILNFASRTFPDFDTVFLAYGSMRNQKDCESSVQILVEELQVDFVSAAAILSLFASNLERRRTGCIAAITSVAGDRGRRSNYVYGSAKGGLSLFLQGLRSRLYPAGVRVITIKPGLVQSPMTDRLPNATHFVDPKQVAHDIARSLERGSPDILYTPRIWRYIMKAVRLVPETIFKRLPL
jgi:decaprenylphospho-beta-D-erythro-pentofuranosid-2-ulose 2-reductase